MPKNELEKWMRYYSSEDAPPWESTKPYSGLQLFLDTPDCPVKTGGNVCELGAGASASSVFLSEHNKGFHVTAVDLCPLAKERFHRLYPQNTVNFLTGDVLDLDCNGELEEKFRETVPPALARDLASGVPQNLNATEGHFFDFIFDLQCFHCLRDVDEFGAIDKIFTWLRPGGYCMVVTGANPEYSELSLAALTQIMGTEAAGGKGFAPETSHATLASQSTLATSIRLPSRPSAGPPLLFKAELVEPFVERGFTAVSCALSNFNPTPAYLKMSSSERVKENEAKAVEASSRGTTLRPGKGLAPLCWEALFYKPDYGDLVAELRS